MNCTWSSYGNWTECSEPCDGGAGNRTSNRTIAQPALYGGQDCIGDDTRIEECNVGPCPGTLIINIPVNYTTYPMLDEEKAPFPLFL